MTRTILETDQKTIMFIKQFGEQRYVLIAHWQSDSLFVLDGLGFLHHPTELIENPFVYVPYKFKSENELIEDIIAHFVMDIWVNRQEIFKITEHIIDREELVQQLKIISKYAF